MEKAEKRSQEVLQELMPVGLKMWVITDPRYDINFGSHSKEKQEQLIAENEAKTIELEENAPGSEQTQLGMKDVITFTSSKDKKVEQSSVNIVKSERNAGEVESACCSKSSTDEERVKAMSS